MKCREMVDLMVGLKRLGVTFEDAWTAAVRRYPPNSNDLGFKARLFDADDPEQEAESLLLFFRRVCEDAWFGRNPELANFGSDLVAFLADDDEGTGIAQKRRVA